MNSAGDAGTGTLREAVNVANQTPGPDTIEFAPGLGEIVLQSEIEITETLDIVGPAGQQVIRGAGSSRLLVVRTASAVVTLQNLFLADGRSSGPGGGDCGAYQIPRGTLASYGDGGAVCSVDDVSLIGTTITASAITGDYISGGGLFSLGNVTLVNSTISGNSSQGQASSGGGLFIGGDLVMSDSVVSANSTNGEFATGGGAAVGGNLTASDSVVSGNSTIADSSRGGGFEVGGDLLLEASSLVDNTTSGASSFGGGGVVSGDVEIIDSRIIGNSTDGDFAFGGGLVGFSPAVIRNSEISGNRTRGTFADGGGLVFQATVTMLDSTISDNATEGENSEDGGATIYGQATIVNSTISGNAALAPGSRTGGLRIGDADATIANSTITANSAASGPGGLTFQIVEVGAYALNLSSSVLAGNSGPEGNFASDPGSGTIVVDVENSLFGDEQAEVTGTSAGNIFSNAPGLEALGDNGCGTPAGAPPGEACVPTHLPGAGSLVIDRGSNPLALASDQRGPGFPRTRNGTTDIGALEADVPPPPPVPADLRVDKTDGDVVAAAGKVLSWRIDYANIGELDGEGVTLIETVPDSTTFNTSLSGDWVCDSAGLAGSQCIFEIGVLPAGASGTVDFSVVVDDEPEVGEIVNTVEIVSTDSAETDPDPANNIAVERTPLSGPGNLTVPGRGSLPGGFVVGFGDPDGTIAAPRLGAAAAAIGDMDGDGLADVAVSAPGADALLLLPGRPFGSDALPFSAFPSPDFSGFLIEADDGFGGLGDRLAGIGDVNGDGLDGLVYSDGAIAFSPLTGPRRGAYLQPGFDTPPAFVADQGGRFAPQDGPELISLQASGPFATSLGGLGDINADGLDDLALAFSFGARPFQLETVFVLFGDSAFAAFQPERFVVEDASAANGLRMTNAGFAQSGFGTSISRLGDFNGDGVDDFAISAPGQGSGAVFVIFGDPELAESSEGFIDTASLDGGNGFVLLGRDDAAGFGTRVAGAGDFDGDGLDDFIVSERRSAGEPGRVHIVFGTGASLPSEVSLEDAGALRFTVVHGAAANDDFGLAVAGLGDVDGDGLDDLALGAPGLAEAFDGQPPVADTGRVFVLFGSAEPSAQYAVAGLDATQGYWLSAPEPGIRFGAGLAGPGDFDGDGVPDLLVTAPETVFDGIPAAGRFWIISGALRPDPDGLAVEIREFSVTPDTVFAGDIAEIRWAADPDDAETTCAGAGLPGTSWQGTGKPASGVSRIETTALEPGTYFPTLSCERNGEIAESEAVLEVLAPPLDIQQFSVSPDSLFVGNIAEISWTATPDDADTVCVGSGLPGTDWNTTGLPASGTREVETSALAPGTYFPTLVCERDGETIEAEATLEVLAPPAALSLAGSRTGLQFFGDRFVQVELTNAGSETAESITLALATPAGYEAIGVFRLAASCSADEAGDFACDADSIPDWQCGPAPDGFACRLEALPAEATAAVVLQLRGEGPGQVEAAANAANALPVAIGIPVLD